MKLSLQMQAKNQNALITDEHSARLPMVRITKVILQNFKNVEYGEIDFHCGKYFVPYGTKADILGLYGQNGSGKTALIDALYILKELLRGSKVQNLFAECVNKNAEFAKLTFLFELQYEDGRVRKAMYEFCIKAVANSADADAGLGASPDFIAAPFSKNKVRILDEVLSMSGPFCGSEHRMNPIIDTTSNELPFGPKSRHKFILGQDKTSQKTLQLEVNKRLAQERSQSFIFMRETLEYLKTIGNYSEYLQVLLELNFFGLNYFFVVNTRSSGLIRLNLALLLHTPMGSFPIQTDDRPTDMPQGTYEIVSRYIPRINTVIEQLIPGLSIKLNPLARTVMKDGSPGQLVELIAVRNGIELPLRDESDGIRRLISMLSLLTAAYNDPSFTLAIDEFDAGIFEYIWGEMLEIFAKHGVGQLIFTAHNLRPLEVISKKFLYFTSTDPKDRYVQLKSIARTNNMRNVYFRQIEHGIEEKVYNETKRDAIIKALRSVKD